jgi:hypothetical protein
MLQRILLALLFCNSFLWCTAQTRNLEAVKINRSIKIDGNLDDVVWKEVPAISDFINSFPTFGQPSNRKTVVRIAYDDVAVYIGAYLYDTIAKVRRQLSQRDVIDMQDTDAFSVGLDTYHDRQNAFVFQVTAAGVQGDGRQSQMGSNNSNLDRTWDAVWESKTSIKPDGWVVEMKIPFSAIRFAKQPIQDWGLQFQRFVRTSNENSTWSPQNPAIGGVINQWGNWTQLKNIVPPLRLSFLPYLSGGVNVSPTNKGTETEWLRSGGMDVKYGINESFTLDMTLIPDFAQVRSDNVFLNLSPFQIKFDDFRPFFTEGTELFNKSNLFYSRRIGAEPGKAGAVLNEFGSDSNYSIKKNPGITRLINATKLSGRTKSNLGIGVFNAIGKSMDAIVLSNITGKDSVINTEPFTNYNIIVLDQALKNRSSITFTNTNVLRKDNSRNANVTAFDFSLFDKQNIYQLAVQMRYSSIWGKQGKKNGFANYSTFSKVSGTIQYQGGLYIESDTYDPNDLGFLQNNNSFGYFGKISYNFFKPTKRFLTHSYEFSFTNNHLYNALTWTDFKVTGGASFLFKNFWDINFYSESVPFWTNDYFEARIPGKLFKGNPYVYFGFNGSSDSRKPFYFSWNIGGAESPLPKDPFFNANLGLRYRFNERFQLSANFNIEQDRGNRGFAFIDGLGNPIMSRRHVKSNTMVLSSQYNFSPRMNLTMRLRHYWSYVDQTNFYQLKSDGYLTEIPFQNNRNRNFNTFNIDMFYTWDFKWGSRIVMAWKNALGGNTQIDPYQNSNYGKNLRQMFINPHSNEVSLKVVYFLDYLHLKRKRQ